MTGYQCPIIHRLNPKARVNVKNGQLKAIKVALRLSRCLVHARVFEVGFYFIFDHLQPQNQSLRRFRFIWDIGVLPQGSFRP